LIGGTSEDAASPPERAREQRAHVDAHRPARCQRDAGPCSAGMALPAADASPSSLTRSYRRPRATSYPPSMARRIPRARKQHRRHHPGYPTCSGSGRAIPCRAPREPCSRRRDQRYPKGDDAPSGVEIMEEPARARDVARQELPALLAMEVRAKRRGLPLAPAERAREPPSKRRELVTNPGLLRPNRAEFGSGSEIKGIVWVPRPGARYNKGLRSRRAAFSDGPTFSFTILPVWSRHLIQKLGDSTSSACSFASAYVMPFCAHSVSS
jgi:hypothetical protein